MGLYLCAYIVCPLAGCETQFRLPFRSTVETCNGWHSADLGSFLPHIWTQTLDSGMLT